MPDIVALAAGRADEELALVQLEQLAEKVVGVADVAGVIDQRGEGGVALDDILAAEGLACLEPGAGLADAVDGGGELVDGVLVQGVFKKEHAVALENLPLFIAEAGRGEAVLGVGHEMVSVLVLYNVRRPIYAKHRWSTSLRDRSSPGDRRPGSITPSPASPLLRSTAPPAPPAPPASPLAI